MVQTVEKLPSSFKKLGDLPELQFFQTAMTLFHSFENLNMFVDVFLHVILRVFVFVHSNFIRFKAESAVFVS